MNRNEQAVRFAQEVLRQLVERCPEAAPLEIQTEAGNAYLGLSQPPGFCIILGLGAASAKYNVMSIYVPDGEQLTNTWLRGTPSMLVEHLATELRSLWASAIHALR